jgi:hypothetical protein
MYQYRQEAIRTQLEFQNIEVCSSLAGRL